MKKILFILFLASILVIPSVFAGGFFNVKNHNIKLTMKDPTNWSVVDGAKGNVLLSYSNGAIREPVYKKGHLIRWKITKTIIPRVHAILLHAEENTDYTLIYYGYNELNDVWPYATCITNGLTNRNGNVRMQTSNFDWTGFPLDNVGQKFWIVKSSDVDCQTNRMVKWDPTSYLFEERTI